MDRFTTLPGVLKPADGTTLKSSEELSVVLAMAAKTVKDNLQQDEETLYINTRRLAVGSVVVILVAAAIGMWWVLSRDIPGGLAWVLGGAIVALLAVALLAIFAPRTERFSIPVENASITRVGLFYWPVGILPLSRERSVLWDPLTGSEAPLTVLDLPPALGEENVATAEGAERPDEAFAAMLDYSGALEQLRPTPVYWPGNEPDSSAQELGAEVSDLWRQTVAVQPTELGGALNFPHAEVGRDWDKVGAAGMHLHHFHTRIEELRDRIDRYRERAEQIVNAAREVLVEHGWQNIARVQDDRAAHFSPGRALAGLGNRALPSAPSAHLLHTPADSVQGVQESLGQLQSALAPLDAAVLVEQQRLAAQEATDLQAAESRFADHRRELDDDRRKIDTVDSEILKLAAILDSQQARINEQTIQIQQGFQAIAQAPLPELQRQVIELHQTMIAASALIDDVNQKIELGAVEATLGGLRQATDRAQAEWQRLAEEMPRRSTEVRERVDRILTELQGLSESPQSVDQGAVQQIQASSRVVERVAREVVSWTATQQNPIAPVEDKDDELGLHLVALRDQRAKLERASESLTALSTAGSGRPITLPDTIQQVETALARFIRLSEETTGVVSAMYNAAETVRTQAQMIARLLQERDALRLAYEQKLAAFQLEEAQEREAIRLHWQQARAQLEQQRAGLDQLAETVRKRLGQSRTAPPLGAAGVIMDEGAVVWPDLVVNQMGHGIDLWGQRVAGIDAPSASGTQVERVRQELEECYEDLRSRTVPTTLPGPDEALEPQLCFVPFWYVETETKPGAGKDAGRRVHIFPPLDLDRPSPTEVPRVESLRYRELSRRLLAYLRRDFINGKEPQEALYFDPAVMTEAGQRLDLQAAAPPMGDIATALFQNWVFIRTPDPVLHRIIENSRNQLIPLDETRALEAWSQGGNRPSNLPPDGPRMPQLPKDEER